MKRSLFLAAALALAACSSTDVPAPERPRDMDEELPAASAGSLWNQDPESLFGNRRAREIGDILTVLVEIDDQAQIINDTQRNRVNQRTFDAPAGFGLPQWVDGNLPGGVTLNPGLELDSEQRMRGQGNFRRRDEVTLRLAARITDKLPNGDLVIEGQQSVQVGYDRRELKIAGVVRPEDISRQNMIQHDRIADADIRYLGRGPLQGTGRPGFGHRILNAVVPF